MIISILSRRFGIRIEDSLRDSTLLDDGFDGWMALPGLTSSGFESVGVGFALVRCDCWVGAGFRRCVLELAEAGCADFVSVGIVLELVVSKRSESYLMFCACCSRCQAAYFSFRSWVARLGGERLCMCKLSRQC